MDRKMWYGQKLSPSIVYSISKAPNNNGLNGNR